jgi:hypothetical protein
MMMRVSVQWECVKEEGVGREWIGCDTCGALFGRCVDFDGRGSSWRFWRHACKKLISRG